MSYGHYTIMHYSPLLLNVTSLYFLCLIFAEAHDTHKGHRYLFV
jgi:hypothetical protein